ncbi:MAG: ATP-binding protein [Burkholderiales bacterium]|nr:ATP-binding protein [Burkholderiales bacterium]
MTERIRSRRRRDRLHDLVATSMVAIVLAVGAAVLVEAVLLSIGAAVGDAGWHRARIGSWIDARIAALEGTPLFALLAGLLATSRAQGLPGGVARDLVALGFALIPFAWLPARRIGPALIARYDGETLRPPPPDDRGGLRWAGPLGDRQADGWMRLQQWCFDGVGRGSSPWYAPWVLPDVDRRFAIALLTGPNGAGKSHLAEAFGRELDGTIRLEALDGRVARWRLRLGVKLADCLWWRRRRVDDPWDVGYLVDDPAARLRLQQFRPRRATLIIADECEPATLRSCVDMLAAHRADFRHPVRLLIIDVAVPSELGLTWDGAARKWKTAARRETEGWGPITVVDLSGVRFDVPQFRAMAFAQSNAAGERLTLAGVDAEWHSLVSGLDGEPMLLAEAIRHVQAGEATFDDLRRDAQVAEAMVARQLQRPTPMEAPDDYGQRRDLLRERVLTGRAAHREHAIRTVLGMADEEAYRAVMIASFANGASIWRLQQQLSWNVDRLGAGRVAQVLGPMPSAEWVPPIKPAVVADEMLRHHFRAPRGAALSEGSAADITRSVRSAWLANPGGTLRTVARWAARGRRDPFVQMLLRPPSLDELREGDTAAMPLRADLARAFFELAVLHGGEVSAALAALQALTDAELSRTADAVSTLLTHPDVHGLPALLLWLRLQQRCWADADALPQNEAARIAIGWTEQIEHLARQTVVNHSECDAVMEAALHAAADAALPLMARLAIPIAGDEAFRAAVVRLCRRVAAVDRLRPLLARVRTCLAVGLAESATAPGGDADVWTRTLLRHLAVGRLDAGVRLQPTRWVPGTAATDDDVGIPWGAARAFALFTQVHVHDGDVAAAEDAAQRVDRMATAHPDHIGFQRERVRAGCALIELQVRLGNPDGAAALAERLAQVAAAWPTDAEIQQQAATAWAWTTAAGAEWDHAVALRAIDALEPIARARPDDVVVQRAAAEGWRCIARALWSVDACAATNAARRTSAIAARFAEHEAIRQSEAEAWTHIACARAEHDPAGTRQAAEQIAEIGAMFPRHAQVQWAAAVAWRMLAFAHRHGDGSDAAGALRQVVAIAEAFPHHAAIHREAAHAWHVYAGIQMNRADVAATTHAARQAAAIATLFPDDEGIQEASAGAWSRVAFASLDADPAAVPALVRRVDAIAARFVDHASIQQRAAESWRCMAARSKDTDAVATEMAVLRVAHIAQRFPDRPGIQRECAEAWRYLAWGQRFIDSAAAVRAARQATEIGDRQRSDAEIRWEGAEAWSYIASLQRTRDAAASEAAADEVARIAHDFPGHEALQRTAARARAFAVEAAVRTGDVAGVARNLAVLDAMVGMQQTALPTVVLRSNPVFDSVRRERDEAHAMVARWRTEVGPPAR